MFFPFSWLPLWQTWSANGLVVYLQCKWSWTVCCLFNESSLPTKKVFCSECVYLSKNDFVWTSKILYELWIEQTVLSKYFQLCNSIDNSGAKTQITNSSSLSFSHIELQLGLQFVSFFISCLFLGSPVYNILKSLFVIIRCHCKYYVWMIAKILFRTCFKYRLTV